MEICDRHFQMGEYVPGGTKITINTHETFALCESCRGELEEFFNKPKKKKPVKKRKTTKKKK